MKRILSAVLLFFLLMMLITSCDITDLVTKENQNGEQTTGEETKEESNSVFQGENKSSDEGTNAATFKDLLKTNPDIQYKITNKDGYYFIGPLEGYLKNINWDSPNSFNFRLDNGEKTTISKGIIDEKDVKINALIEAPAEGIYINDSLKDEKGLVFISLLNEKSFYWYKNSEFKEYKNIEFYIISPLQKYIVLFSGDYKTKPILIELTSGKEAGLPIEADHGWPVYSLGISFSADESKLLYEDWSKMELCIYDIKGQKELQRISEKGFSLIEASYSPNGKMAAFLKYDDKQPIMYMKDEGRSSLGHKLEIYDLEKKKIIKEIAGEPLIYSKPIWSPNSMYLIVNMTEISMDEAKVQKLQGNPYLLNISTGKIKKLGDSETGLKYVTGWSADSRKVIANSNGKDSLEKTSAIDINLGDALDIDANKYYICRGKSAGTDSYEIISIENSKLDQFNEKRNKSLSTDEKYIVFSTTIDNKEYIIVGPRQVPSK